MLQKGKLHFIDLENQQTNKNDKNCLWFNAISFAVLIQSMILVVILVINFESYDWTTSQISTFFIQLLVIGLVISVVYYKIASLIEESTSIYSLLKFKFFHKKNFRSFINGQKKSAAESFFKNNEEHYGKESFR